MKRHEENGANKGFTYISTYLGYGILVVFGHLRDFFGKLCGYSRYFNQGSKPPKVSSYSIGERSTFARSGYSLPALLVPLPV
jgi:hypothetical protein